MVKSGCFLSALLVVFCISAAGMHARAAEAENPGRQVVVILPDSGNDVSPWSSTSEAAKWFGSKGIATVTLGRKATFSQVHEAIRHCRKEQGVSQVGVFGAFGGGCLAASAQTEYPDSQARPDFSILVNPSVVSDGENLSARVTGDTPVTFVATGTGEARVSPSEGIDFFNALAGAKSHSELHSYPDLEECRGEFEASLGRWLEAVRTGDTEPLRKTAVTEPFDAHHMKPDTTLLLYPQGQNSSVGLTGGPGEAITVSGPERWGDRMFLFNVADSARFDLYFPEKSKATGQMVVICPGGGYFVLCLQNEGVRVVDWLLDHGIAACVLDYRMPMGGHHAVPMTDYENTMRYLRSRQSEWGIDKIGVFGFSAGGHLAAMASTIFSSPETRPDFCGLFYAAISMRKEIACPVTYWNWIGRSDYDTLPQYKEFPASGLATQKALENYYSGELRVAAGTPPTFVAACIDDDTVPIVNSLDYFRALLPYGTPSELHVFPYGRHGWGFDTVEYVDDKIGFCRQELFGALERFMEANR